MDKSGWGYASDALRCLNWCLTKGASISGAAEAVRQVWVPLNALCPIIWQSAVAARPRSACLLSCSTATLAIGSTAASHLPTCPLDPAVNSWGANLGKLDIEAWSDAKSPPGVFGDMQELLQNDTVVRTHLFVTASGNDGRQLAPQQSGGTYFFVPAQLQAESILTVGATGARPFPAGQGWQPGIVGWRNAVPAGLHSTAVCP